MSLLEKARKMNLLISLLSLALGVVFIIFPTQTIEIACYLIGGASLIYGIINVVNYFMNKKEEYSYSLILLKGIALIIIGLIIVVKPEYLISFFPIVFGILFIFEGISYIQKALLLKNNNVQNWTLEMVSACITLAFGAFILLNPYKTAKIVLIILGIAFVWYGIASIFNFIYVQKKINIIKTAEDKNEIIDVIDVE